MERAVGSNLKNTIKDLELTKDEAFSRIEKFLTFCRDGKFKPMLYYTGHGETDTGNWCFSDGTISIEEIFSKTRGKYFPTIISDACFSGRWADFCFKKGIDGFDCLSACDNGETAFDTDNGGELTLFITGQSYKLRTGRPQRVPLFGTKTPYSPEIVIGQFGYSSLVGSIVKESDDILIDQSVHDGEFYGIFGSHARLEGSTKWWCSNWSNIIEYINEEYEENYYVYSLETDQITEKVYAFLMQGYGYGQFIESVKTASEVDFDSYPSYAVTSVTSDGNWFRVVMTSGAPGYSGSQIVATRGSWNATRDKIREEYDTGKIITGICYNRGQSAYMVVMTQSSNAQSYKWFEPDDVTERKRWMGTQMDDGKYPTIVFRDPTDEKYLLVVTSDYNRSGYKFIPGFELIIY